MSKAFKKRFGVAPTIYRKRLSDAKRSQSTDSVEDEV